MHVCIAHFGDTPSKVEDLQHAFSLEDSQKHLKEVALTGGQSDSKRKDLEQSFAVIILISSDISESDYSIKDLLEIAPHASFLMFGKTVKGASDNVRDLIAEWQEYSTPYTDHLYLYKQVQKIYREKQKLIAKKSRQQRLIDEMEKSLNIDGLVYIQANELYEKSASVDLLNDAAALARGDNIAVQNYGAIEVGNLSGQIMEEQKETADGRRVKYELTCNNVIRSLHREFNGNIANLHQGSIVRLVVDVEWGAIIVYKCAGGYLSGVTANQAAVHECDSQLDELKDAVGRILTS
jgi:hypothetical protein